MLQLTVGHQIIVFEVLLCVLPLSCDQIDVPLSRFLLFTDVMYFDCVLEASVVSTYGTKQFELLVCMFHYGLGRRSNHLGLPLRYVHDCLEVNVVGNVYEKKFYFPHT